VTPAEDMFVGTFPTEGTPMARVFVGISVLRPFVGTELATVAPFIGI